MDSAPNPPPPVTWQPNRMPKPVAWPVPAFGTAIMRGLKGRCPACGETKLFRGYLTVVDVCANCAAPLGSARADDAPPYFTILIVAHIVITGMVLVEHLYAPSELVQAAIWLPVTTLLCLGLLRPIKGATVGVMLKNGMFKSSDD